MKDWEIKFMHEDLEREQLFSDPDDWCGDWSYSSERDLRDPTINPEMGVNKSGSPKGAPPPKNAHYIAGNDPFRYATDNDLNVLEFSVIKYVTRHRRKNGKEDLEKARNVLDRLIKEYYG